MGISRDSMHKRRHTGGKRKSIRKKRKFMMARPPSHTKIGPKRIHVVRCRGGNLKFRAMRLDNGNFSWGSEAVSRKTRILDVVYNASNNELVRTKTLVKNAIVTVCLSIGLFFFSLSRSHLFPARCKMKLSDSHDSSQRYYDSTNVLDYNSLIAFTQISFFSTLPKSYARSNRTNIHRRSTPLRSEPGTRLITVLHLERRKEKPRMLPMRMSRNQRVSRRN